MAVRCCQGDGDIELSYDPTQEPTQSDAARETGTLRCPTTKSRSRGVAVRCCQGDGDIEMSHDPTQEPRGWLAHAIYF